MQKPNFLYVLLVLIMIFSFNKGGGLSAHILDDDFIIAQNDAIMPLNDSTLLSVSDSTLLSINDSSMMSELDSLIAVKPKGMLDAPAFSTARDSIIEDFSDGKSIVYYYGDVEVKSGEMSLKAEYMKYDASSQTVFASGVPDTLDNMIGEPQMTDAGKTYDMETVFYNFKSGKAKIKNMVTKEADGILHGHTLKMMPDKSINIKGGKYTVCDHPEPHYYLNMTTAKVMTQPKQKTVFGPAWLVVADVPIPVPLPFGFVPSMPDRASGILFPSYGEEAARGFFLKDLGYYFVVGNYFDISLTGDIYTLGSWAGRLTSRYKLKYKFDGSLNLSYSNDVLEKGETDEIKSTNFSVQWSHSQDSKARPGTSFRASVNFSSPSNNKYNSDNLEQMMESSISSSVSYSKTWSKMSLSLNGLHSQNSRDSSYAITLPNITFNVNRFYPFRKKIRSGKKKKYEEISLSYNTAFQNKINFTAKEIKEPDFWNKMKNGMTHAFQIGLPTFDLFTYLNFSPSISYGMNWYFQTQDRIYNPETNQVETITSDMFSTFGISQTASASLSLNTRLYGMFNFGPKSKIRAIRHMVTPSLSLNYSPELGIPMNGLRTYNYTDKDGVEHSLEYNKYSGGINSPPGKGQTAGLSFALGNNFEAKVFDKRDTTGTGLKKIKLIDNLNLQGSYNFLADSMKLSNVGITMNTTIFEKLGVSGNLTLDPYAVNATGQRYNKFNIAQEGGFNLFRLTNASASLSYNISGDGIGKGNDGQEGGSDSGGSQGESGGNSLDGGMEGGMNEHGSMQSSGYNRVYYHPVTGEYIPGGWVYYLNPNVNWSLSLSYSYSYNKSYQYANQQLQIKNNHTQTLGISAQVRLTKDLNFNINTGVDVTRLKLTTTQLSATYDLHCFQISVQWIPNGQWSSWSFRIQAKASALADLLKYKKSSSFWDN